MPSLSVMETVVLAPNKGNPISSLPVTDTLNVSVVSRTPSVMIMMFALDEFKEPLLNVTVKGSGTT